jgi:DNA (cytosine-5)-methyltransferase 1
MRPRLLDVFCGAGGASMGYHRAGFDVVGVDIEPQPNYPFEFARMDALVALECIATGRALANQWRAGFKAIHASPPCQAYSKAQRIRGNDHNRLIAAVRELLEQTGLPYVIENVPDAAGELRDPVMLCGTMFGLPLYRHRLFECSFPVTAPLHGEHWLRQVKMGRKLGPGEIVQAVGNFTGVGAAREAMGIDWMTRDELAQAIPPTYTEHIGGRLMAELKARQEVEA